jgi:hypothetical protein
MGDWVYRVRNGKTILGMKPINTKEPSQAQLDQRARFAEAAAYAKRIMADAQAREAYEIAAEQKDKPAFALCVADFLKPPSIKSVNTSAYAGNEGNTIGIVTVDDMGVVNVAVTITDQAGNVIESGQAVEKAFGGWTYTVTASVAPGVPVIVKVVATDRPGGIAVQDVPLTIP